MEQLLPDEETAFVVKARHSIFFETPLAYLLNTSGVDRVVLCGQVTEQCILYSALDAYVRHFDVVVATDAVAAIDDDLAAAALRMMERNMHAELVTSHDAFAVAAGRADHLTVNGDGSALREYLPSPSEQAERERTPVANARERADWQRGTA